MMRLCFRLKPHRGYSDLRGEMIDTVVVIVACVAALILAFIISALTGWMYY